MLKWEFLESGALQEQSTFDDNPEMVGEHSGPEWSEREWEMVS